MVVFQLLEKCKTLGYDEVSIHLDKVKNLCIRLNDKIEFVFVAKTDEIAVVLSHSWSIQLQQDVELLRHLLTVQKADIIRELSTERIGQ